MAITASTRIDTVQNTFHAVAQIDEIMEQIKAKEGVSLMRQYITITTVDNKKVCIFIRYIISLEEMYPPIQKNLKSPI